MNGTGVAGATVGGPGPMSSMLGKDMGMQPRKRKKRGESKGVKPKIPSDKKLSRKHHMESIKFNMAHAKDHVKEAKGHRMALKQLAKGKVQF